MDKKLLWNRETEAERSSLGSARSAKRKQTRIKGRFCDTPEFVAQRDKWYKILADSGFKDIEVPVPGNGDCWDMMKGLDGEKIRTWLTPQQVKDRVLLYQRAGRFYWHLVRSKRKREAVVWEMFAVDQLPKHRICARLKVSTRFVSTTLAKLKREFLVPEWDADEDDAEDGT